MKIEVLRQVALECLQALDRRRVVPQGGIREQDELARANLVPGGHQRLGVVRSAFGSSPTCRKPPSPERERLPEPAVQAIVILQPSQCDSGRVRKVAARAAGSSLAWFRSPGRSSPEALPVVSRRKAPGEIKPQKLSIGRSAFGPAPSSG